MAARKPVKTEMKIPYRFIGSLAFLSLVSAVLLAVRIVNSNSVRYGFMFWNLFLAAVPLLLAWWLVHRVRQDGWLKWPQMVLAAAWFVFLPNSFYLITDLIHLRSNFEADLLFDITVLMSFILAGLAFGFASLYLVHKELGKRLSDLRAYGAVAVILLAASFAICLGRYTRWNTWDIILQPAGLLFDVSDRLINPATHFQTYHTTVTLFLLLLGTYAVVWEAARLLQRR
jgi:uncharacterized membrane protein